MDIRYIQNSILQIAMARKKFLLTDTIEAVQATSMWFGLIVSARMNRLDAQKYLIYVLEQLSASETITEEPTTQDFMDLIEYTKDWQTAEEVTPESVTMEESQSRTLLQYISRFSLSRQYLFDTYQYHLIDGVSQ